MQTRTPSRIASLAATCCSMAGKASTIVTEEPSQLSIRATDGATIVVADGLNIICWSCDQLRTVLASVERITAIYANDGGCWLRLPYDL